MSIPKPEALVELTSAATRRIWGRLTNPLACAVALSLTVLLGGAGCVSSRAFVPGEHVTAFSPEGGHYAAEYTIMDSGHALAEVKVWSRGASRDGSGDSTLIHVGFEVNNQSDSALRFDPNQLYLDEVGARQPTPVKAARVDGDSRVQPGQNAELDVWFELPRDVWPSDVAGYRVGWTVTNGRRYSQQTPFFHAVNRRDLDPWYGYSAPYGVYYGYSSWPWPYRYRSWPPPRRYRRYY